LQSWVEGAKAAFDGRAGSVSRFDRQCLASLGINAEATAMAFKLVQKKVSGHAGFKKQAVLF
jgi:hypothetical protein